MKHKAVLVMVAAMIAGSSMLSTTVAVEARAPHYTITERQEKLTREISAGQKANELDLKQANKLRDRLAELSAEISKMKAKNGGKLSYEDQGKVEKTLNKISVDMQKQKLEKRVTAR